MWPVGQAVKTPASHAGNAGSIPARVTISLVSSPARAVNTKAGVYYGEVPPVPIPNTEVKLRLAHPEDTLAQLAQRCDPPITKSALNHRLRKLVELGRG